MKATEWKEYWTQSPPPEPDNGLRTVTLLGHLGQQAGRDPARAAIRCPFPPRSPYYHRGPGQPAEPLHACFLPCKSGVIKLYLGELLRLTCDNTRQVCSTQLIHNPHAINGLLAFSSPAFMAVFDSTRFSFHFSHFFPTGSQHLPLSPRLSPL